MYGPCIRGNVPTVLLSFYRWNCWYIDRYTKILKLLDVYMFFLLHSVAFVVAFALRGKLMDSRLIVIAIGGNSLIEDSSHVTVDAQYKAAEKTAHHIAKLIADGHRVVIAHGNGPQVGYILRSYLDDWKEQIFIGPWNAEGTADTGWLYLPKQGGYLPSGLKFIVCPKYPPLDPLNGNFTTWIKVSYGILDGSGADSYYKSYLAESSANASYDFKKTGTPSAFFVVGESLQIDPGNDTKLYRKAMRSKLPIQTRDATTRPVFPHANRANLLMLDGHCESLSYPEMRNKFGRMLTNPVQNKGFMYWNQSEQPIPAH